MAPAAKPKTEILHLTEFFVEAAPKDKPAEKKRIAISRATADFNQASWTIQHAIDGKN